MISEDELVSLIDTEFTNTIGGSSEDYASDHELTEVWEQALNYYFGRTRGDEVDGRSKVISMDLADMVEQTMAQILPAFEIDDLGSFEAYSAQDQNQADAESTAVNWVLFSQNNGQTELASAIKTGLLQRNGIIELYIDESTDVIQEDYENVPLNILSQIDETPGVEILSADVVSEGIFDEESGVMLQEPVYNIQVKRFNQIKQGKLEAVPPEEFRVNADHRSIFLHEARFVSRTTYPTRSELIQRGFDPDVVELLPATTVRTNIDARARSRDEQENEMDAAQRASDRIKVDRCYYRVDTDEDGIVELHKIIKAGKHILDDTIFPIIPFASGSPFPFPHRFFGVSLYDKLKQTQDTKTSFLRKTLDNAESLINQRVTVVPSQVNMEDVLSSRPNGVVRAKRIDAVSPWPLQNLGDTGFKMLGYMDKMRKEAGGAQLDLGTQENMPVQGQTAHGMERWMSSQEQLSYMMIKNYANTLVKGMYRIMHTLLREFMPEKLTYKYKGQMIAMEPGTWPERPRVTINVQLSMAERQRQYVILGDIIEKQKELMSSGFNGVLANTQTLYQAQVDQAKIAGFNPEKYWIDPNSPQAQQAAQQNQQAAEQAKLEEQQQNDKLLQTQVLISQMQEKSDELREQLGYAIKVNEQLRKWTEMELEYSTDIPGEGKTGAIQ